METSPINMEPYKGVRDFYPRDMFIQNYIFNTMRKVVESFGYVEYSASVLEPAELYRAKTGEEIVREQTYSFVDRGEREVTLRPEMTPTVARMVARNRRELSLPLRWYSIPNLFRYESPQRGRLREHWQLNTDIFGVSSLEAEAEIIEIAVNIMRSFGAKENQFEIRVNSRRLINAIYDYFELSPAERQAVSRLIDKKEKMQSEVFSRELKEIIGERTGDFIALIENRDTGRFIREAPPEIAKTEGINEVKAVVEKLARRGVSNVRFAPSLIRGFDYYTAIVFEVFDTGTENRRSLFGGGRYDDLLDIFGLEKVTAVGFGMGDVTIRDFLETYNLIPPYRPATDLYLCRIDVSETDVDAISREFRKNGLKVAVDLTERKVGDQIKAASRQEIPFVACIGKNELETGMVTVKHLATGKEVTLPRPAVAAFIKKLSVLAEHEENSF